MRQKVLCPERDEASCLPLPAPGPNPPRDAQATFREQDLGLLLVT